MPLTVTLEISDAELDYFRSVMSRVRAHAGQRPPQEVAPGRRGRSGAPALDGPLAVRRPSHRPRRAADRDARGSANGRCRRRSRRGYSTRSPTWRDAHDLVPDNVPVLGLVDDAIMLELVLRELQHELDGYEEFDAFRREEAPRRDKPGMHRPVSRDDWLQSRREALHARIRERRERDLARDGEAFRLITRF